MLFIMFRNKKLLHKSKYYSKIVSKNFKQITSEMETNFGVAKKCFENLFGNDFADTGMFRLEDIGMLHCGNISHEVFYFCNL